MKAVEITEFGAPEVLRLTERYMPKLNEGEVLIKVVAAGVNRPDILQRKGLYPAPLGCSDLLGLEVAGEIVDGASGAFDGANPFSLKMGDRVCALLQGGGYAEYCTVPLAQCLPIPSGFSEIEAATLPEALFTTWSNVFDRARLGVREDGEKETLLVQGGTSGIGVMAIQLAVALGHSVFATAGSMDKVHACEKLGAERGINYKTEDFVVVTKALTADRGVDVILDMVGGDYLLREIQALAMDGRISLIAFLGGSKVELDIRMLLHRRLTVTASTLRARSVAFKASIAKKLYLYVWPLLAAGKIRPVIYEAFSFYEAARAHELMESGTHIGKLVMTW
ncbi:NAD(P)H-quinone oxidoreductase [Candidatus Pandoraea novymonadis]|uniref:Phthiocerol synthesis polyketide synthase type I PpsC n=1 Tax=Candidatus Pandoraea novymonadis TaxID=1808959 RepID=A0ABX5FF46_9BURK|nr:NAD(P)H-quinone oxidoreductase [Candidatus Pandoraea novymonadis]PSB91842.1 Phthiocerol synthesis polyketide synthase type I PpsC [Candidatus Pandoraea novymonadis]